MAKLPNPYPYSQLVTSGTGPWIRGPHSEAPRHPLSPTRIPSVCLQCYPRTVHSSVLRQQCLAGPFPQSSLPTFHLPLHLTRRSPPSELHPLPRSAVTWLQLRLLHSPGSLRILRIPPTIRSWTADSHSTTFAQSVGYFTLQLWRVPHWPIS